VHDRLERRTAVGIGEDESAQTGSVQSPVGAEHVGPERGHHGVEPGRAGTDDLAGQCVGIDHDGAEFSQDRRDGALS
jgi:hypothetical protein